MPRWETSKSPTPARTAACSASTPPPAYSMGIDQPLKSASLAPAATCRSWRGDGHGARYDAGGDASRGAAYGSSRAADDHRHRPPAGEADRRRRRRRRRQGPRRPAAHPRSARRSTGCSAAGCCPRSPTWAPAAAEDEVTRLPSFGQGPFPVVAVAGLGAPDAAGGYRPEAVRRAAGAASRALGGRRSVVSLLAAVGGTPDADRLHAVGEGALLGAYEFTAYKSDLPGRPPGAAERVHRRRARRRRRPRPRCAGCAPSPTPSRWSATWSTPRPTTSTPPSSPPAAPPPARRPA